MFDNETNNIHSYLANNHIPKLYHFTDRSNLFSIIKNGGLLSWWACENEDIHINRPGGDDLSRRLDSHKHLEDYVRLSFCEKHPMMSTPENKKRIPKPIIIEISTDVCELDGALFSDINATANGAQIKSGIEGLKLVDFRVVKQDHYTEEEKPRYQAEVLVKHRIPLDYFLNLEQLENYLTETERKEIKQLRQQQRDKEIEEIRRNLPTPTITLLEQIGTNYVDQKVKIRWEAKNYSRATINGKPVGSNYVELCAGTAKCKLEVINEAVYKDGTTTITKDVSKTITIKLYPVPNIRVDVDKLLIKRGKENDVRVCWDIDNIVTADLYIGEKCIGLGRKRRGESLGQLSESTPIYIRAIGLDGKRVFESDTKYIEAKYEAIINSFGSDKRYSITDVPFIISWNVSHANRVYIRNDEDILADDLGLSGAGQYTLKNRTFLTICAEDDFGIKRETVELDVMPKPHIKFVTIPIPDIERNTNLQVLIKKPFPGIKFPNVINTESSAFAPTKLITRKVQKGEINVREQGLKDAIQQSIDYDNRSRNKWLVGFRSIKNIAKRIINKM